MSGQQRRQAAPGQELATQQRASLRKLVESYESDLSRVMPPQTNPEAFFGLALAYVRRDARLLEAATVNPQSLILALRECAALGHMPIKGKYALVAFNDKNAPGGKSIVGIEEYRGVIQRIYQGSGGLAHVQLVHENDTFHWPDRTKLPVHHWDLLAPDEDRGPVVGVYAWASLPDGRLSEVVWMNMHEVAKHERAARTDVFWKGPWRPDMIKKTALHQLERYAPASEKFLFQVSTSEAAASQMSTVPDVPTHAGDPNRVDTTIDGEIVPDGPAEPGGWPPVPEPGSAK